MLCKLRHYVNEASTKSIYYAIFYYDLSHVCPAYGQNLNPNHRIKLLQKKAMRKVSFAHHDPHTLPIFSLRRFEPCSRPVVDLRWWGSLTTVPAGNKAKCLSSVNYTTKPIHYHYHQIFWSDLIMHLFVVI